MDEKTVKEWIKQVIEEEAKAKKTLSDTEMQERAAAFAQFSYEGASCAETRSTDVGTEFIKLEVQIATLLFVFMGLFVNVFVSNDSVLNSFWVKVALSAGIFSLILSLIMGLMHLKLDEKFWEDLLSQRYLRFNKWIEATKRGVTFKEAEAFHEGTALDKGKVVRSPRWAWIMQSIFLGIGVATLFILFLGYIFTANPVQVGVI